MPPSTHIGKIIINPSSRTVAFGDLSNLSFFVFQDKVHFKINDHTAAVFVTGGSGWVHLAITTQVVPVQNVGITVELVP